MTKSKSPWDDEIVLVNAVDQGNGANSGDAIVDAAAPAVAANLSSNPIDGQLHHHCVRDGGDHDDMVLAGIIHNSLNLNDHASSQAHATWPTTEQHQGEVIAEAIPVFTPVGGPQQGAASSFPMQAPPGVYPPNCPSTVKDSNIRMKNDGSQTSTTAKKQPAVGLWKMAGRKIRQHQAGKVLLDGIRDGIDGTKKTLGIGVGQIIVDFEQGKVYRPEEVVKGFVKMELTEPIPAKSLMVRLQGTRECTKVVVNPKTGVKGTKRERRVVHSTDYQISGQQSYPCNGNVPFQVVVPRLRHEMNREEKNTLVGSIISSVQMVNDAMKSPIVWSIYATLVIPGRLNMSSKSCRIHVGNGSSDPS